MLSSMLPPIAQLADVNVQPLAPAISAKPIDFYPFFFDVIHGSATANGQRNENDLTQIIVDGEDIYTYGNADTEPWPAEWANIDYEKPHRLVVNLAVVAVESFEDQHALSLGHALLHLPDIEFTSMPLNGFDEFYSMLRK